jgi:hypothetical protein
MVGGAGHFQGTRCLQRHSEVSFQERDLGRAGQAVIKERDPWPGKSLAPGWGIGETPAVVNEAEQSALLVIVPEAEPAVAALRATLDGAAAKGVPAHITVLVPFVAPALIDDAVLTAVREVVGAVPRFEVDLAAVAWFGDRVAYVEPRPDEPFRRLTAALVSRFPECPPYGGEFAEVVPHLTIGEGAPREVLAAAGAQVEPLLPIPVRVASVWLMTGSDEAGSWRVVAEFPLG